MLTWIVSCRSCPHCLRGETQLCLHAYDHAYGAPYAESAAGPVWPGMGVGSLAEETLLPAAAVVPVDESLPLEHAALLGCGVTTGVGAVIRTAAVRPGDSVLVIGCGGVGLAAIQAARLSGAARIIAADRVAAQLPAAVRQRRDPHHRRERRRPRRRGARPHRRRRCRSRNRGGGQARHHPGGL